jgi:hypothetical protein
MRWRKTTRGMMETWSMSISKAEKLRTYRREWARAHRQKRKAKARDRIKINATARAYYAANKERIKGRQRARRAADPERARANRVRKLFGLTQEEQYALLDAQGHACAICRRGVRFASADWFEIACFDHCHSTGKARGILCSECNIGVGKFANDPERLAEAARYLNRHANLEDNG